jgi:cysteinyl-tRNA synthetase
MLKVYNTLTRKKEEFKPLKKGKVGFYSCGPTVYNYAHIGNLRTYIFNDLLKRTLEFLGFRVNHVMNITDVDDKTIRGSVKEGESLEKFTRKYEKIFFEDLSSLNIVKPSHVLRATESIEDMVKLIKVLLEKGIAYKTSDGIYFSIKKSKGYGKLAMLDKIKDRKERVKADEYDKDNAQDFALWKFYTEDDGEVYWDTEIGKGRPGWHIECSAMSMKILGKQLDIHTGAIDLIFPHHTNEIAQSEGVTGKQFVKYWLHGAFLTMKEGKMSKSIGNILTLKDLINEGYNPLHYRYLCLLTHYRSPLVFSYENLDAAKTTYERLKRKIVELKKESHKGNDETSKYEKEFKEAIEDDLNIPQAVQVLWRVIDDFDFDVKKKIKLLERFDSVLGLGIGEMKDEKVDVPKEVKELIKERDEARKKKDWKRADVLRGLIKERGFIVEDSSEGTKVSKA